MLYAVIEFLTNPILYINVIIHFGSSLVVWARQNANDFMPRNNYNNGDTAKMIFADFDVSFGPNTEF